MLGWPSHLQVGVGGRGGGGGEIFRAPIYIIIRIHVNMIFKAKSMTSIQIS